MKTAAKLTWQTQPVDVPGLDADVRIAIPPGHDAPAAREEAREVARTVAAVGKYYASGPLFLPGTLFLPGPITVRRGRR